MSISEIELNKIVRETYWIVTRNDEEFSKSFYIFLFDKYPQLAPLFVKTNMEQQRDKIIKSLDLIVLNLNNPKRFNSELKNLGAKHVNYGSELEHYPLVGDALLQALEKHLGEHWNPTVKNAWILAYERIAKAMTEGAKTEMRTHKKTSRKETTTSKNISSKKYYVSINKLGSKIDKLGVKIDKLILVICSGVILFLIYTIWNSNQLQLNRTPNQLEMRNN
jgi:hemoglobin-like flavoprotein